MKDVVEHLGTLSPGNYKTAEAITIVSAKLGGYAIQRAIYRTLERLQILGGLGDRKSFLLEELERELNGGPTTNL